MTVRIKILLTNFIIIAVFIFISVIIFTTLSSLSENTRMVSHTYDVIGRGNKLVSLMVDQETGMRGFLATGNEDYLDPYFSGTEEFSGLMASTQNLVNDNPAQVARLEQIEKSARNWDEKAAQRFIAMRREIVLGDKLRDAVQRRMTSGEGKARMDAFRAAIAPYSGSAGADRVLEDMVNMETGLRGFIATHDEGFLEPYRNGITDIREHLAALGVGRVTTLANDWIENFAEIQRGDMVESNQYADMADLTELLAQNIGKTYMDGIREDIKVFIDTEADLLVIRNQNATDQTDRAYMIIIVGVALASLLAIVLSLYITSAIRKQLGAEPGNLAAIAESVARGDLSQKIDGRENATGVFKSVIAMVQALREKAAALEIIASGDFSGQITKASEQDVLGNSMIVMQDSLTNVLDQVRQAVDQVTQGAGQVSQASQSLSQGATEQASSLEEISSSITQINGQANQNAQSASEANKLAVEARDNAVSGNHSMESLIQAMNDINAGSDEIKKVVKVIDDIAFQINLLALNANVEAARAGKYGRGFAVVAEEVRNLATRSTDAVRETTGIVDQSVANVAQGDKLVKDTASQLELIVSGAGKVASLLDEIASASREQAQGLNQVSEGVEQIDQVTQANTASAEESASASEELAGQAGELGRIVSQFKLADSMTRLIAHDDFAPQAGSNNDAMQMSNQ
jgi:methyl-accepting chemotaxis protein